MNLEVPRAARLRGSIRVPGDKSISHRALILAAMARGSSIIRNPAPGQDVASTARCVEALGTRIGRTSEGLTVEGNGWATPASGLLDAGNSGTTIRLLAGALAGRRGTFELTGDASLRRRPMDRIAVPLNRMGASVELTAGHAPVVVRGGDLTGITFESPVPSAQVKSAVLLAGLQAEGTTEVKEWPPSRDHTERLLSWLGVPLRARPGTAGVDGGGILPLEPFSMNVPGDFSSAAFFIAAACLVPGSDLTVAGVGLNPTRTGLLEVLAAMGARVDAEDEPAEAEPEPAGTVRVRASELRAATVEGDAIPRVIDELPLVALAATQAEGTTVIRDAGELRVKESDRIAALAEGLATLGAEVEVALDGMAIHGPVRLGGGRVHARGDHRLALTFAVAGLFASGPVVVEDWECAAVSYPGFIEDLSLVAA